MELADRHVVITGAGRGIGRALALRFADEGARAIVVSDLDAATAQGVAEETGGLAVAADVGREEDIRALVAQAEEANGPIDLFFSNAGITGPSGGPEVLDADWDLHVARQHALARVGGARAAAGDARARRGLPREHRIGRRACSPSSARSATRSPSTGPSRSPSGCR